MRADVTIFKLTLTWIDDVISCGCRGDMFISYKYAAWVISKVRKAQQHFFYLFAKPSEDQSTTHHTKGYTYFGVLQTFEMIPY